MCVTKHYFFSPVTILEFLASDMIGREKWRKYEWLNGCKKSEDVNTQGMVKNNIKEVKKI